MDPLPCDGVGQRERTAVFLSIMPKVLYHMATITLNKTKSSHLTLWLNRENKHISAELEMPVTNRQVLQMAHASLAFSVLTCSAFLSIWSALFCLVWFMYSLYLCKKGGLR